MSAYKDYRLSPDTTAEAEGFIFRLLSEKSPAEKLRIAGQISATVRTFALSGLRERYPGETSMQINIRLVELLYGPDAAGEIAKRLKEPQAVNEEPMAVTLLVIAALDALGIRYLIGGSLASAIYGEPRATRDADLLADIRHEHVESLYEKLNDEFNISKEAMINALTHRSSFNVIHFQSLFKVDVFIPKHRQFDEQEFQRRALHVVAYHPEQRAYVASAEDIILAKLDWYRQGNETSEQQWRDITGIFKASPSRLDVQYMQQTAGQLGISDLLDRLIPTA